MTRTGDPSQMLNNTDEQTSTTSDTYHPLAQQRGKLYGYRHLIVPFANQIKTKPNIYQQK